MYLSFYRLNESGMLSDKSAQLGFERNTEHPWALLLGTALKAKKIHNWVQASLGTWPSRDTVMFGKTPIGNHLGHPRAAPTGNKLILLLLELAAKIMPMLMGL